MRPGVALGIEFIVIRTMIYLKFILSAGIIVGASELAKRNLVWGALLCALPLTSILTMSWTWVETPDPARISALSISILAYTVPSLVLFIILPILLRVGLSYWPALVCACLLTAGFYRLCDPLITKWTA